MSLPHMMCQNAISCKSFTDYQHEIYVILCDSFTILPLTRFQRRWWQILVFIWFLNEAPAIFVVVHSFPSNRSRIIIIIVVVCKIYVIFGSFIHRYLECLGCWIWAMKIKCNGSNGAVKSYGMMICWWWCRCVLMKQEEFSQSIACFFCDLCTWAYYREILGLFHLMTLLCFISLERQACQTVIHEIIP